MNTHCHSSTERVVTKGKRVGKPCYVPCAKPATHIVNLEINEGTVSNHGTAFCLEHATSYAESYFYLPPERRLVVPLAGLANA